MTAPAGAAKTMARHKTIKVLSISEVYKVFQNRGGLYGGNSRLKVETSPFKTVFDKAQDTKNIKQIPSTAIPITAPKDAIPANEDGTTAPINIVAINI